MRRSRLAVLGLLLSAALAVGVAPASAATAFGLTWNADAAASGGTTSTLWATTEAFQPGQTVRLQLLRGSSWVDRRVLSGTALTGQAVVSIDLASLVPGPGRYALRALTRVSAGAPVTEARLTVTLRRDRQWIFTPYLLDSTTTARNRTLAVTVSPALGQLVTLQRKSGRHWRTVTRTHAAGGYSADLVVRVPTRAGNTTYRVVGSGSTWMSTGVSETFTLNQTDTAKYRSYIRTIRKIIAGYCPRTPVYIDAPGVAPGFSTVGLAWLRALPNGRTTTYIEIQSGLTGKELRHVALHECAHIVQYRLDRVGRYGELTAATNKLYGGNGIERQADCMAYYFVRWKPALYYLNGCSRAQLRNAARLWRAYGKKDQASVF